MTPAEVGGQVLLNHELQIEPRGVVYAYEDYWGAMVEAFDIHEPHRVLEIVALSTVETPGGAPGRAGSVMGRDRGRRRSRTGSAST